MSKKSPSEQYEEQQNLEELTARTDDAAKLLANMKMADRFMPRAGMFKVEIKLASAVHRYLKAKLESMTPADG